MKTKPIVSVVIPVYNGSNFLQYAIESALLQTYRNCEVVVVNDGSDDNGATRRVANRYGTKIKYVEQSNGGTSSALNHGLRIMNGDYFVWLSHDDVLRPYKVESQLAAIRASGEEDTIAQGNYSFINESTGGVVTTKFEKYYPLDIVNHGCFLFLWGETHFSNLLFSFHHFDRIGKFNVDKKTTQDQDMQFRLLRGQKTVFVKEPVSLFRMHGESESIKSKGLMFEENRLLYLQMMNELTEKEIEASGIKAGVLYAHIASIIHSMGDGDELSSVEELMRKHMAFSNDDKVDKGLSDIAERGIVIFGAGAYGKRIKYELESRGIKPKGFIDNSPLKWETIIDGLPCYSVSSLDGMDSSYVVIGQKSYADAYQQLKALGCGYVLLKDELDALLCRVQPIKVPEREGQPIEVEE